MRLRDVACIQSVIIAVGAFCSFPTIASAAPETGAVRQVAPAELEIVMSASTDTFAQVFFDTGKGFEESSSLRFWTGPSSRASSQRVPLPVPSSRLRRVRFDPIAGAGRASIHRLALLDASGREVARLSYGDVRPFWQVESWREGKDGAMELITTPGADDPYVLLNPGPFRGGVPLAAVRLVRGRSLALIAFCLLLGLVVAGVALGRQLVASSHASPDRRAKTPLIVALALAAALGTLVLGSRLWLIEAFGSSVFYLDSWHQIDGLFLPYAQGWLGWGEMFAAHNEHRIFFTRVLDLGLLLVNRQWDGYLSTVVNAFVPALSASVLALVLWSLAGRQHIEVIVASTGLAWALPVGWENTLAGFQSQFFFLILFSILGIWLVLGHRPGTGPWLCGVCFSVASLFTVAAGVLTPATIALVTALRLVGQPRSRRADITTVVTAALLLGVGLLLQPSAVVKHHSLRAQSPREFFVTLGACLAFPNVEGPWLALLAWIPFALLAGHALRCRRVGAIQELLFALGLWVILNAAALAFGRGGQGGVVPSRYMDALGLGLVVNAVSAAWLLADSLSRPGWRVAAAVGAAVWTLVSAAGMDRLTRASLESGAPTRRAWLERYEENIRRFLVTDDPAALSFLRFPEETPYPNWSWLANAWLRNPWVRHVLPAALRDPLPLVPRETAGFVQGGAYPTTPVDPSRPAWGSYGGQGDRTTGHWVSPPLQCTPQLDLRFEVAGYLGKEGLSLALRPGDPVSRALPVRPARAPGESWLGAVVRCPSGPFVIAAEDRALGSWFAFRAPTEMGRLSAWSETLASWGRPLVWVSLGTFALLWRRRQPSDLPSATGKRAEL
jgi:hypothetical protein